jgi:acetyl esterase/lipase
MQAMQRYRLGTFPCDTADMTRNTISALFPIRLGTHFVPLHSPDSADSLIFFSPESESARRNRRGIHPERLKQAAISGTFKAVCCFRIHMPFITKLRRRLAALALALPGLLPAQTPSPATNAAPVYPPPPAGIVVLHDVVIGRGGDRDLHAEIAYPQDATGPLPAVIYIHGGGWSGGSYKDMPVLQLAKAGYFAASIEYRLSNVAKWPAQIQDCKLGVRWLRANAAKYHVDPNRIGAWGGSAGGHLVACLGTMADVKDYEGDGGYPGVSSAVQAVVDFFGPTDFTDPRIDLYPPSSVRLAEGLFGVSHDQNPELWKSGSPTAYVKAGDPPILIVHGDADQVVPVAQAILFDAALTQAGVPHQLIIVKNGGHGFAPRPGTTIVPGNGEIDQAVYAFLAKYLKGP